jgi:(S)-ureidoglycine aminohydrolase
MKSFGIATIIFLALIQISSTNLNSPMKANVYNWKKLEVKQTNSGERRQILDGKTEVFDHFEIHVTTLKPGKAPHGSHTHNDHEELIIVKEGKIKQTIGDEEKILGPGSIVLAMPGDEHGISNAGETNASYYIIKWKTNDFSMKDKTNAHKSVMMDWNDFEFTTTKKGGRRQVMRNATSMVDELEMHVTTLNEGMKSHDQHTHLDEEIIVVLKGEVEEMIDDHPYPAETGSLIYLSSMIPHGIRNAGKGQCEYYAIRWIPKGK